jgi:SHS2 domain-containing protein
MGHHSFAEHTGEVELYIEGASLADLFEEAGRALAALMRGEPGARLHGADERVSVCAPDREALLVAWLDELIFRAETNKRIYSDLRVERISDRELHAVIRGAHPKSLRTAVKAATYHRLRVEGDEHGWRASVVLDV